MAANSSRPEGLHEVHIITTPPNANKTLAVPVIYGRVKGEETWNQQRDRDRERQEDEYERRRREGGIEVR